MWKAFEQGSSPIDWCEGNYNISPSIAEFMNTLSNALFLLLPPVLMHLFRDYGRFVNPGIHVIWLLLMVVGISSAYFHATLSLVGQLLDELSILWVYMAAFCMFFPRRYFPTAAKNNRKRFSLFATLPTLAATILAMFHPAINAFALMTLGIPAFAFLILELKRTKSARVYRLGLRCGAMWLLAVTCWLNDRLFCDTWLSLNFPYLHALWHLFIFIASYTAAVLFAYFSVKEERPQQSPMLKYWPRDDFELGIPLGPEVNIGVCYHIFKYLGLLPKPQCWQIERGNGLSTVSSCEGIGIPVYFYLEFVWLCTLVTGYTLFIYATNLSGSIGGGLIAIASFFFNHNECTRVQWTPPLRESFAYPALLVEMCMITKILKKRKKPDSISTYYDLVLLTAFCLLSWQFSQFVFVTQTVAMLILKWLKIIDKEMYLFYCTVHLLAVGVAVALTSNSFLLNSLHLALLFVSSCCCNSQALSNIFDPKTVTLLEIATTLTCTKLWKIMFTNSGDDEHIFNILRTKISSYKDFHTMLYTCSPEFDFLKYETYEILVITFLLPTAILAGFLVLYYWYRNLRSQGFPNCIEPHVAYNMLQTGAFTVMAIFVMRLKLFMTPHLCIIAGLACSKRYLEKLGIKKKTAQGALIALLLAMMSYHGVQRVIKEREFIGEYSNIEQEELLEWIQAKTPKTAAFAGKMSLMANIMLSTRRPIVNNPYYESKEMQDKTMKVYEIYSRKSPAEVHETLQKLQVDYLVIEEGFCYGYGYWKPGCKMVEIWDLVDKGQAKSEGKIPVCPMLFRGNAHPFRRVFENRKYVVLQLNYTKYIEFKPKIKTILYTS